MINLIKTTDKSNGLSKKTKIQLLEIIKRKDAVEREIRAELKELKYKCNKLEKNNLANTNALNTVKHRYNNLKDDFEDVCDDLAIYKCKAESNKFFKYVIGFILIISVIFNVMFILN